VPVADRQQRLSRELAFAAFARPDARGMPSWVLDRLAALLEERRLSAGETLYARNDPPSSIYFMSEGRVELVREGSPTWTFEGRWVLGTHEALLERPRNRTAVALTDLELVTVRADAWLDLVEDSFETARMIVESSARGLVAHYSRLGDAAFPAPAPAPPLPLPAGRLDLVERLLILSEVALLREAHVQTLTNLAAAAEEVAFAPGEDLFVRGRPRDRLIIVADGLVEAERQDPPVSGQFGPGDLVTGAAALGDRTREWRARAVEPTRALTLRIDLLVDELEEHFDMVRSAMAAMSAEVQRLMDLSVERTPGLVFR
jgi:CRP-like cAMP-binding protein